MMEEVVEFLSSDNPNVRLEAVKIAKSYSTLPSSPLHSPTSINALKALVQDSNPLIAHDALSALINLSSESQDVQKQTGDADFLVFLLTRLHGRDNVLSDLMLMCLSNITKHPTVVTAMLDLKANNNSPVPGQGPLLSLVELFIKGEGKKWNEHANFDFLASVFSNLTSDARARTVLLTPTKEEGQPPLLELAVFTEHPSIIRRGGVASIFKNCMIDRASHASILPSLLPRLLLPLCGPEEYDVDRALNMPPEIQLLPPDKKREPDPAIRLMLLETLGLLATTYGGRKYMREVEVYEVLRVLHLAETVQANIVAIDRLVQLLMRDEGEETKKDGSHPDGEEGEKEDKGSDDEDFTVQEL
ncbi:DUF383-domain-containing protein [Atractiella rhizophila]|nr:DUF383-domain-containing protein [Atractiella rhizophila]